MENVSNEINELTMNSLISKQNSQINLLSQEKFSNFLKDETSNSDTQEQNKNENLDIVKLSLQNEALLNKMLLESVA